MVNVKLSDGTSWPWPVFDSDKTSLEWRLRYGEPTTWLCLQAASIVSAYQALVEMPRSRREQVVRELRKAGNP